MITQLAIKRVYSDEWDYIDLENVKLQFVKSNSLFSFDKLSTERTTSFNIPATPRNIFILGYANSYQLGYKSIDRKTLDARMVIGVVEYSGYLYISQYSHEKRTFSCVFVTGENILLKQLKDLGNVSDLLDDDTIIRYKENSNIQFYFSTSDDGQVSYDLGWLLGTILQKKNIAIYPAISKVNVGLPNENFTSNYRLIVANPKPLSRTISITQSIIDRTQPYSPFPDNAYNSISSTYKDEYFTEDMALVRLLSAGGTTIAYNAVFLVSNFNVKITFPMSFSSDYMLYNGNTFLGDYAIDSNGVVTGDPLTGRTIEIASGEKFIIVNKNDYNVSREGFYPTLIEEGVFGDIVITYDDTIQQGTPISLKDNMQDMTVIDLLKIYANAQSKLIYCSERELKRGAGSYPYDANTIYLLDEVFDVYYDLSYNIDKVVSVNNMRRTFSDFAQHNYIDFDSEDELQTRVSINYDIDNKNINENNTLYTFPLSEGLGFEGGSVSVLEKNVLCYCNDVFGLELTKITLAKNNNIQSLCDSSTSIEIECVMPLYDYYNINSITKILFDYEIWVWTSIRWSNGIASLNLSRI